MMNYLKIYNDLINKRKVDPYLLGYGEVHHILPRCLGGNDSEDNLVKLSAKEHYIAHLLLVEIHKNNKPIYYKMLKAIIMMGAVSKNHKGNRYFNSNIYKIYKDDFAKCMSESQSGDKNSQFGKIWVYNESTRISKKDFKR